MAQFLSFGTENRGRKKGKGGHQREKGVKRPLRLAVSSDPAPRPSSHSPLDAGPGARGPGGPGSVSWRGSPGCARTGRSARVRSGRARRPVGTAQVPGQRVDVQGPLGGSRGRRLLLWRRGTRKCEGAGLRDLTQVPAPVPPPLRTRPTGARPLEAPPMRARGPARPSLFQCCSRSPGLLAVSGSRRSSLASGTAIPSQGSVS